MTGAPCGGFGREALHTHTHTQTQASTNTETYDIYEKITLRVGLFKRIALSHTCITYCIGVARVEGFPITSGHQHQQGETETETC